MIKPLAIPHISEDQWQSIYDCVSQLDGWECTCKDGVVRGVGSMARAAIHTLEGLLDAAIEPTPRTTPSLQVHSHPSSCDTQS